MGEAGQYSLDGGNMHKKFVNFLVGKEEHCEREFGDGS
jgi:hypothetical protein